MYKKKILILGLLSVLALSANADKYIVTAHEQAQILNEADSWIDDMPDGLQDRLSDAVRHAMHGFNSEIEYFRNYADTTGLGKYKVEKRDLVCGVSNIPVRIYESAPLKNESRPVLIYFHGGGWSMGSPANVERFCSALASEGNVTVVSVAYPLAPEHPYPVAGAGCAEVVEYISRHANEFGGKADNVSLGGDGAGGNLALQVYENLPEDIKIKSLVMYYPLIASEGELNSEDKRAYGRGYGFDSRLWEAFTEAYGGKDVNIQKGLPPTLLISAGRDIVVRQGKELAKKDSAITIVEFEGAIHGFITDNRQPTAFAKAVELTDKFLSGK